MKLDVGVKKFLACLVVALAFLNFSGRSASAGDWAGQFPDANSHWAAESIAQCRANQLMSGYPGNLFMPDQSLTRAEALVVIGRSLGWDRQTAGMSVTGIKFPPDLWKDFRGYVALAANKSLFGKNDIPGMKFNQPAPRIELAVWLARALNLSGSGSGLNFSDLSGVSDADRNLLAGVVQAGIMKGLPGNLFGPSKPLTRAEMASILTSLMDGGKITPSSGKYVAGKLSQVDRAQNKISVEAPSGAASYDLSPGCLIYRQGALSDLGSFKVGEKVRASLDKAGKCVVLSYAGDGPLPPEEKTETYSGTVLNMLSGLMVFQPDGGQALLLPLSSGAGATISGAGADLSSVVAGARGTITVAGGKVTSIDLAGPSPSSQGEKGYVVNKYLDYFTVHLGYGALKDVWSSKVYFTRNGASSTYQGITRGSYVELIKSGEVVTAVNILDGDRKVFGELKQANSNFITILDGDERLYEYQVGSETRAYDEDGDRIEIDDLDTERDVELTLDSGDNILQIRLGSDSGNELEGTVEELRTSGVRRITIRDTGGDDHTYYLSGGVTVREGSTARSLGDVRLDDQIQLTLDSNKEVILIEINGTATIEGEVTDIRTSGTKRIGIKKSNGLEDTYYLNDDVPVRERSLARRLQDVQEGMAVRLTLNNGDRVTKIEITDFPSAEGEVTDIRFSEVREIEIEMASGNERTYNLAEGVSVREESRRLNLGDVDEGMYVKLSMNSSGEVDLIEIIGKSTVEGDVTYIQTAGNNKSVEIKDSYDRKRAYTLLGSATVREEGATRSLNFILKGMKVRLTVNSYDEVTWIDILNLPEVEGRVTDIKVSGRKWIIVEDSSGRESTYYLTDYVHVEEDGDYRDLNDIDIGMYVQLTLDDNIDVGRIEITSLTSVEGEVTYIRTTETERISIKKSGGNEETYYIDEGVTIREGSRTRELDDIAEGMKVRLRLDEDLRVTRVEIIGETRVRGEVTYIRTYGTERIRILRDNNQEETFYIGEDTQVKDGNTTLNLDEIREGMDVELTLDDNDEVVDIEIL